VPIIHIQVPPLVTAISGNPSVHPPADNLHLNGPTVQVTVTVSQDIAAQLTQAGHPAPTPVAGTDLIDTGASSTCIDDAIAQQLGLPVIDVVQMSSASHASTPANIYPLQVAIAGLPMSFNAQRAMVAELQSKGIILLLGHDLLRFCTLHYNGFSIEFTPAI